MLPHDRLPSLQLVNRLDGRYSGSYSHQQFHFNHGGDAQLHDVQGALYALLTKSMFYVLFDVVFGSSSGRLERGIEFTHFKQKAHGDVNIVPRDFLR